MSKLAWSSGSIHRDFGKYINNPKNHVLHNKMTNK